VSYESPSQEWWACVVYIPFTGVASLCCIHPLHRSGGPVSYTSPSQEWRACVVYIPFMALGPMSYYLCPGPFLDEWVHLFLERCSKTPSYRQAPLRGAGD
jgi:hypothetical protein